MDFKNLLIKPGADETPDYRAVIAELKNGRGVEEPDLTKAAKLELKEHDINDRRLRPDKPVRVDKTTPAIGAKQITSTGDEGASDEDVRYEKVARVALALQKLIVKRAVAFTFGNPIYLNAETGDNEEQKKVLKAVERVLYDVKQKSLNRKVARKLFSCTEVAELWYPVPRDHSAYGFDSKFKLRCAVFDPLVDRLYPYFDDSDDMIAFSREFTITRGKETKVYFETYTEDFHFMWDLSEGKYNLVEGYPKENVIKKIPVVFGRQEDVEWADVQNLIDRLEKLLSNFADTNDYHASPKIVVKGELTGFAKKGEAGALLQLEGEDASASYLAWQNAPESVKLEIQTLLQMIYTITQTPDISFDAVKGLGAISGVALKLLFMDAHLKVADHSEVLDEYLQRRMNIIKAFIGKFDVNLEKAAEAIQIEPEIIPYMLDDELSDITKWTTANGNKPLISQKQSAILAGLSKDPEADFAQMQAEESLANRFSFNEPTV